MYSFLFIRDMLTVNLFGGKQFKQGHLSLGSWKRILVEVMSCEKNVFSVLRESNLMWTFIVLNLQHLD